MGWSYCDAILKMGHKLYIIKCTREVKLKFIGYKNGPGNLPAETLQTSTAQVLPSLINDLLPDAHCMSSKAYEDEKKEWFEAVMIGKLCAGGRINGGPLVYASTFRYPI